VFDGRVESANSEGSDGLTLTIKGRSDRVFYHHLSKRFINRRGQTVEKDQVLGESGASSNGAAHLHIALEKGNPERFCPGPYLGRCF
jgi:murein DD-endopeptidase MepM/ murein hydrolase activator NlpD